MVEEFRSIPGYEFYSVSKSGLIKSIVRDKLLGQWVLDGYLIVDTFRGSLTETLPVHRAVALAWVDNPDPVKYTLVNHKDGDKKNNWYENLEWTDYSGNNYHAVNNDLRNDNIECKIRNFHTKEILFFKSIAQAVRYMGFSPDMAYSRLKPKKFGRLLAGKYEFKFINDMTPWFYENRTKLVPPARFMVTVINSDGSQEDFFSGVELLKTFKLYNCRNRAMKNLADFAQDLYPDKQFIFTNLLIKEEPERVYRKTKKSFPMPVLARKNSERRSFSSLTKCARFFNVDRSTIMLRIRNKQTLDEWTFTNTASPLSNE